MDWSRKWLVDFNAGKMKLVLFDQSNNTSAIDVKKDGSVLEEKLSFKMLGWLSLLNWIRALTFIVLLKLLPRILEPWFVLWSFFFLRLRCISKNLPYSHAWNTVVMSGLKVLVASLNNYLSYKNVYVSLQLYTYNLFGILKIEAIV